MGTLSPLASILNAIYTFFISLLIASAQRVFPFFLSRTYASATEWGTSMPNLCVFFRNCALRFLTNAMMCLRLHNTVFTHQLKAGSSSMPCKTAYSATAKGYASFRSLRDCQEVDLSFQWMHRCHPTVEQCNELHPLWTICCPSLNTALALDLCVGRKVPTSSAL
jgi:hypothetical protein